MNDVKTESLWLMHGDCLERMKEIPDGSVDLILADPPYQKTQNSWDSIIPLEPMWEQINRVIKPNGAIVLFGQNTFTFKLGLSNEKMFRYTLTWEKTKAGGFLNAKRMPLQAHEDILVFYKKLPTYNPQFEEGKPYTKKAVTNGDGRNYGNFDRVGQVSVNDGKRYPRSVQYFRTAECENQIHPTQKPIELLKYLVATYSDTGEMVLDNVMGSGTCPLAAKELNRSFIGIEKEVKYYDLAVGRVFGQHCH